MNHKDSCKNDCGQSRWSAESFLIIYFCFGNRDEILSKSSFVSQPLLHLSARLRQFVLNANKHEKKCPSFILKLIVAASTASLLCERSWTREAAATVLCLIDQQPYKLNQATCFWQVISLRGARQVIEKVWEEGVSHIQQAVWLDHTDAFNPTGLVPSYWNGSWAPWKVPPVETS